MASRPTVTGTAPGTGPRHHARRRGLGGSVGENGFARRQRRARGDRGAEPEGQRGRRRARVPAQPHRQSPATRTPHRLDRRARAGPEQRVLQRGAARDRGPRASRGRGGDRLEHRRGRRAGTGDRPRARRPPDRRTHPDARQPAPGLPRHRPGRRPGGGRRRPSTARHGHRRRRRRQPGRRGRGDRSPDRARAPPDRLPGRQREHLHRGGTAGRLPDGAAGVSDPPRPGAGADGPAHPRGRRPGHARACSASTTRRRRSSPRAT